MKVIAVRRAVWCGLVLLAGAGCGARDYSRYVPSDDRARQALEAALAAWQKGQAVGKVEGGPVPIQVVDSRWRQGQKLGSFEILKEEPAEGPKVYSVRLTMAKPAGVQTVRYLVVGKEPLWVYREDDYRKPAGM
jgi:hypothetical protein